jgi:hypothetical protein
MRRKLQVFVSSTYSDLIPERQAAVAAILKAGHIPAGMELFTAGDTSQMNTIQRWINESDVYMLILGGRYGSIEPTTNLSYTELEYDYARTIGKPTFAVVINDDALERKIKLGGSGFIEKGNPKALEQFRKKVLSNISSFFSDEKDIKLCIYESLSDLAENPNLKGWVAANEIEDIKVLNDEIKKLREENATLTESLHKTEAIITPPSKLENELEEDLVDILKAIEIKLPPFLAENDKEQTTNLLDVTLHNLNPLINGVSNRAGMSDIGKFYYFNILPKLQIHGLADNEAIPGVRYRRSFLNKSGKELFARLERERLLKRKKAAAKDEKKN